MSLRLPPLPTVRDLVKLYRLRALKQLSQNFLLDSRITDKIVKAAGGHKLLDSEVCEVGPGPGPISRSILNFGVKKLLLIEKDPRFEPTLKLLSDAAPGRVEVILGDVLSFDMSQLFSEELRRPWEEHSPNISLIGNLPFNVSTPLIIRWLKAISERRNVWTYGRVPLTLTFQHEVAERIVAKNSEEHRCRLSVMCQTWCHVKYKFTIPGKAFVPKPDVNVGVVRLVPKVTPSISAPFSVVEKVARNIFSFRQKYCIRGAETLFPVVLREKMANEMFSRADVNPHIRPYQLTMEEMARLAEQYWTMCQNMPRLFEYNHRAALEDRGEDTWEEEGLTLSHLAPTSPPPSAGLIP